MAKKQCPVCGKPIAAQAKYCIFCSAKFDRIPLEEETVRPKRKRTTAPKKSLALVITVLSLVVIAIVLLLILIGPKPNNSGTNSDTASTTVTTTTRNAALDAHRQTYIGYWYDEHSAGKDDLKKQGGYVLYIEEIFRDSVTFDLLSYEGGGGKIASASIDKAVIVEDTLHFTFENDTLGHSGEGFMRLADDCIEMEVIIDGADKLPENEHSLAVYAVFKRRSLPTSEGYDLKALTSFDEVKKVAGKETQASQKDDKGNTTYVFGCLKVVTDAKGKLVRLTVDYSKESDKTAYCYVCVDGTMTYDTVKMYFGEAVHDYVEQPTDIRVLHYTLSKTSSVTFTFDADTQLLTTIQYIL